MGLEAACSKETGALSTQQTQPTGGMITELRVSGLRGVQEAHVTDLGPLVVLVGPNGCGKSTLLDALLIGGGNSPGDAIGRVVKRRPNLPLGARWLISSNNENASALIDVTRLARNGLENRQTSLEWSDTVPQELEERFDLHSGPVCGVSANVTTTAGPLNSFVAFTGDNEYKSYSTGANIRGWEIRLVDSPHGTNQPLEQVYSSAVEKGRKDQAVAALRSVLGERVKDITLLMDRRFPVVHLVFEDGSIPVAVAGEGVVSLVRLALELAARPRGVVLLEEPETHQHPAMIWQSAQVIWATVERNVQIILSTHSLELLDALLAHAPKGKLDALSVYRVKLDAGRLSYHRISGGDVASMRSEFEEDLR